MHNNYIPDFILSRILSDSLGSIRPIMLKHPKDPSLVNLTNNLPHCVIYSTRWLNYCLSLIYSSLCDSFTIKLQLWALKYDKTLVRERVGNFETCDN